MEKWQQEEQLTSRRMNQMIDEISEAIQNVTQDVRLTTLERRTLTLETDVRAKVSGADVDSKISAERTKIDRELNKKASSVDLDKKVGDLKSELTSTINSKPELGVIEQKISAAVRGKVEEGLVDSKIAKARETLDALINAKASGEQLNQSIDGIRREVATALAQKIGISELNQASRNIQETFNSQLAGKVGSGEVDAAIKAERKKIDKELSKKITPSEVDDKIRNAVQDKVTSGEVDSKITSALQNHSGGVNQEQVEQAVSNALVKVDEKIDKKAEKTDVSRQIEQAKSELSSQIGEKITEQKAQQLIQHALAGHKGTTDGETVGKMIESAIGVERQRVDTALQNKANITDVEGLRGEISGKIDEKSAKALIKAERKLIDRELEKKVESTLLESKVSELNSIINGKADTTAIDTAIKAERKKIDKEIEKKVGEARVSELIQQSETKLTSQIETAVSDKVTSNVVDSKISAEREKINLELGKKLSLSELEEKLSDLKNDDFARLSDVDELLNRLKAGEVQNALGDLGVITFEPIKDFNKIVELHQLWEDANRTYIFDEYEETLLQFDESRREEIKSMMPNFDAIKYRQGAAVKLDPIKKLLKLILNDLQLTQNLCFELNKMSGDNRGKEMIKAVIGMVAHFDNFSNVDIDRWTEQDWAKTTKRFIYMHLFIVFQKLLDKQNERWAYNLYGEYRREVSEVNVDADMVDLDSDWKNELRYSVRPLLNLPSRVFIDEFFKIANVREVVSIWYGLISQSNYELFAQEVFINSAPSETELRRKGLGGEDLLWFFEASGNDGAAGFSIWSSRSTAMSINNLAGAQELVELNVGEMYNFAINPQHLCVGLPRISFNAGRSNFYLKCKIYKLGRN